MNDKSGYIDNKLLLYTNNSAILVVDTDISSVKNSLQTDLQIVSELLIGNKL